MSLLISNVARRGGHRRPRALLLRPPSSHPLIANCRDIIDDRNDSDDNGMAKHHLSQHHRNISVASRPRREECPHQSSSSRRYHSQSWHHAGLLASTTPTATSTTNNNLSLSTRQYHNTPKREILPLLAVGFLGASAVYTYRTFQQMDQDWEEYYDELEEYKAVTGIDPEEQDANNNSNNNNATTASNAAGAASEENLSNFFTGGTLAIDMGTTRLKLSHRNKKSQFNNNNNANNGKQKPPSPLVSVDREGFRSTPSLVWMPPPSSSSSSGMGEEMLIGRLAEARLYDTKGGSVVHPREALLLLGNNSTNNSGGGDSMNNPTEAAIQQTIRAVACNALDQVLGGNSGGGGSSSKNNPLFVLDESMSMLGSYNVRPIFTYPPPQNGQSDGSSTNDAYLEGYQQAVSGLTSPAGIAAFVPEPVAVVSGAEYYNLLPRKNTSLGTSVLVIDVGGASTSVSMVGGDAEVMHSTSLPFGGDTFIDLLVSHLVEGFYGRNKDDDTSNGAKTTNLSSKPNLNDPTALQRLYEASTTAIHELSNKTRSEINIPYLTMDLETRQPKHLEVGMARTVVNTEVESFVREKLVPHLENTNSHATSPLSQALPSPTNLSTLFSSTIMSSLEQTSQTPHMLRAILLVGGGARIPLVREAIKEGVGYLAGEAYASGSGGESTKRLIMPEGEMGEELGVLGAAVWGSGGR
ncbi:hypothetical protein ACHAXR_004923 [Thalassiosira sp. AJA248-18]